MILFEFEVICGKKFDQQIYFAWYKCDKYPRASVSKKYFLILVKIAILFHLLLFQWKVCSETNMRRMVFIYHQTKEILWSDTPRTKIKRYFPVFTVPKAIWWPNGMSVLISHCVPGSNPVSQGHECFWSTIQTSHLLGTSIKMVQLHQDLSNTVSAVHTTTITVPHFVYWKRSCPL